MGEPNAYNHNKNQILFVNNLLERYNVIVSGSANNEVTHIFMFSNCDDFLRNDKLKLIAINNRVSHMKLPSEFIEDVHLIFDPDDFLSFLAVRSILDKIRDNHRKNKQGSRILGTEIINAILDTTGAIPLEINRYVSQNHI